MADWSHETRRFIYRTPDPKWLTIRASARALAAELLRWVDDDGAIYLREGEHPWQGIARMIQAGREDHDWVRRSLKALVEDGHLSAEASRIVIRNFKVAQEILESADELSKQRSKEAVKKARQRAAKRAQSEGAPEDTSTDAQGDREGDNQGDTSRDNDGDTTGDTQGDTSRDNDGDTTGDSLAPARVPAPAPAPPRASAGAHSLPFPSVPTTATTTRAREVWEGLQERLGRLGEVDHKDLGTWCSELGASLDLPPAASATPYVRHAMAKLADVVTANPGTTVKARLTFVSRTTVGLVNQDKPNHWASGKTDGKEGVCAPTVGPPRSVQQSGARRGGTGDGSFDMAAFEANRPRRSRGDS